jgi:hypothetical protein
MSFALSHSFPRGVSVAFTNVTNATSMTINSLGFTPRAVIAYGSVGGTPSTNTTGFGVATGTGSNQVGLGFDSVLTSYILFDTGAGGDTRFAVTSFTESSVSITRSQGSSNLWGLMLVIGDISA